MAADAAAEEDDEMDEEEGHRQDEMQRIQTQLDKADNRCWQDKPLAKACLFAQGGLTQCL